MGGDGSEGVSLDDTSKDEGDRQAAPGQVLAAGALNGRGGSSGPGPRVLHRLLHPHVNLTPISCLLAPAAAPASAAAAAAVR